MVESAFVIPSLLEHSGQTGRETLWRIYILQMHGLALEGQQSVHAIPLQILRLVRHPAVRFFAAEISES